MIKPPRLFERFYGLLVILAAIPLWAATIWVFHIPSFLVPSPATVASSMVAHASLLTANLLVTLRETIIGFIVGTCIGMPLGFGVVLWRPLERTIYPFLIMFEATPKVAIAPLLVVWIGLGATTRIVQASIVVFFPILINTAVGLRSTSRDMIDMMRSMRASRLQIFTKLQIPNALPSIFAGLKIALPLAVVGAIVAEFVGGSTGLGAMLLEAEGAFDTGLLFASIVVLALMGVFLFRVVEALEWLIIGDGGRRLNRWRAVVAMKRRRGQAVPLGKAP